MPQPPRTKFSKEKDLDFITVVKKMSKMRPSPNAYQKDTAWTPRGITPWKNSAQRITVIDEIGKKGKQSPGPSTYRPENKRHLSLGKIMKCEGVGFMENTIYHS